MNKQDKLWTFLIKAIASNEGGPFKYFYFYDSYFKRHTSIYRYRLVSY